MTLTIDVAITTWPNHPRRIDYLAQTLAAIEKIMYASQHRVRLYCSAESERDERCTWHGDELEELCRKHDVELRWHEGMSNLGANMNAAIRMGSGELVFLQQDDWCLQYPLDLSAGANLLNSHPEVDLVRYCWPDAHNMRPTLSKGPDNWRRIDPNGLWLYGDDPHLRRRDFMEKWGWYFDAGGHASASATLLQQMVCESGFVVVADKIYYRHIGYVSSVLEDVREGAGRRYENQGSDECIESA